MKKKVVICLVALVCIVGAVAAFLYGGRSGGEIGLGATINRVEDGIAYATVTDDNTGLVLGNCLRVLYLKLPIWRSCKLVIKFVVVI